MEKGDSVNVILQLFLRSQKQYGTYVRDFPLKTTGGATAAKTQNTMWTCKHRKIYDSWTFESDIQDIFDFVFCNMDSGTGMYPVGSNLNFFESF